MPDQIREILTNSKVIICEGNSDCRFLTVLLERRGVRGYQILKHANGKTGFANRLRSIRTYDDFDTLDAVVLVTDNDDEPAVSFRRIQSQIQEVGVYPVPREPWRTMEGANHPSITVIMLPSIGVQGGMENLVLEAISDTQPKIRECLNEYLACTPALSWNINKQSKMLLGCMVAAICEGNPIGSLSYLWNEHNNLRGLLDHRCFDNLATFLNTFSE